MFKKLFIILFISSNAFAFDEQYTYRLFDVDRLSLEQKKFVHNRDPYFPNKDNWITKTDLYWNVRIYRVFWENDIHMANDEKQVREVGWKSIGGIHVFHWLDFVWDHHSRHSLEMVNPVQRFPVEDSYGIRINFIEPKYEHIE